MDVNTNSMNIWSRLFRKFFFHIPILVVYQPLKLDMFQSEVYKNFVSFPPTFFGIKWHSKMLVHYKKLTTHDG